MSKQRQLRLALNNRQYDCALGLARNTLERGELLRLQVQGRSMAPVLRPGDVIMVQAVRPSALRRGDLLVFRRGPGLVTHRLVLVAAETWLTKGDALSHADAPVYDTQIVGRVVHIERGGRRIDLRRRPLSSQLLGWLGWLELRLLAGLAEQRRAESSWRAAPALTRLGALPFRLLTWLLG